MSNRINDIRSLVQKYGFDFSKKPSPGQDLIQYSGPTFTEDEFISAIDSLLDGWFGLGKNAELFEQKSSKLLGKKYGVYVNSGSSANLIALLTMKEVYKNHIDKGRNKIIVPASSFPTTVNPIIQLGFIPVFVDVELETYSPVHEQVMDALSDPEVIGMMFAHPLGSPVKNTKLYFDLLESNDGFLIEDCCDCLGGKYDQDNVGTFSHASTLSFYMAHHITTGEGGMVAFKRKKHERIAKSFRDWGRGCFCSGKEVLTDCGACKKRFSNWIDENITDHRYVYERIGFNLKPIEMQACIGLAQLEKLESLIKRRNENFEILKKELKDLDPFLHLPKSNEGTSPSWFSFPITIRDSSKIKRADIISFLESSKIQTRTFFAGNVLKHPPYKQFLTNQIYDLKNSDKIYMDTFMVGVWPGNDVNAMIYIGQMIKDAVNKIKIY